MIMAYLAVLSPNVQPMLFENLVSGSLRNSYNAHVSLCCAQTLSSSNLRLPELLGKVLTISSPLMPFALPHALMTHASLKARTDINRLALDLIQIFNVPGEMLGRDRGVTGPESPCVPNSGSGGESPQSLPPIHPPSSTPHSARLDRASETARPADCTRGAD